MKKSVKLSLIAALFTASSVYAIENTKVSGDANLFYLTTDSNQKVGNQELFDQDTSAADISLNLNLTTDLVKNNSVALSAGAGMTALTTLGLENNMVSNTWGSAHEGVATASSKLGAKAENSFWLNEAWVAATAGKTTVKLGRMELDTPLAFTEKWTIEKNTFEGAVLLNESIPGTTLVAAYIGNGNGSEVLGVKPNGNTRSIGGVAGVVNMDGKFDTYGRNGAYAVAAINNSWKPLTFQAWYYDVSGVADATWLQADLDMSGVIFGFQRAGIDYDNQSYGFFQGAQSHAYAGRIGYAVKDGMSINLNYSSVDKDAPAAFNTATNHGVAQTKLYTECWWNYGTATSAGTDSTTLNIDIPTSFVDIGIYASHFDRPAGTEGLQEATLAISKSFDFVDASIANTYVRSNGNADRNTNMIQVYLTANF